MRGEGLLIGVKCRIPNTEFGAALRAQKNAERRAGDNVQRLIAPLIITEDEINIAMQKLEPPAWIVKRKYLRHE